MIPRAIRTNRILLSAVTLLAALTVVATYIAGERAGTGRVRHPLGRLLHHAAT